ncbi:type II toxin-antitoxin system ParD family antitoxin [Porticoccus sp. W117]|uniref:type II toxin-antitoxin system ParD family antitoxin n=1 Tax=Porticoccus sp. W117 TaxID=3054777 RepID=UPI002594F99E|nr:type II toxin-antitoxin system ParD family antitoxin [Porticoccus sp. W117]MDM3870976.1 type II toxin-antitoxin system ParD family antitoxin [Porticoccus sp. W117]
MSYTVGRHFDQFIREQVRAGRYNNGSEVVREGLRLVEEREARLAALRQHLADSIERGGSHTDDELDALLQQDIQS